ncbi:uncharacterized protein LOC131940100 [Physella acuta]|uniref:uncharacterized protein LOC131940100 n=1 Tax=Physella acuta TaxID=109671 RepID=UPI0027DCDAB6|nr:uncharacterized protein LOC131940100 [Physella acuta]
MALVLTQDYNDVCTSQANSNVQEIVRLASFLPICKQIHGNVYCIRLSAAGFRYTGTGTTVKCDFCDISHDINSIVSDPSDKEYHKALCIIPNEITTADSIENDNKIDFAPQASGFTNIDKQPENICSVNIELQNDTLVMEDTFPKESNTHDFNEGDDEGYADVSEQPTALPIFYFLSAADPVSGITRHNSNSSNSSGYNSDSSLASSELSDYSVESIYFDDSDLFESEYCDSKVKYQSSQVNGRECKKNPGHFAYFPLATLTLEQIPANTRHPDVLKFLNFWGTLTARIVVSTPSNAAYRTGTGFVFDLTGLEHKKLNNIRKFVPFLKKNKSRVYVQTNKHLVKDVEDVGNTVVEFYDRLEKKCSLKVESVLFRKTAGDSSVILICKCPDPSFAQLLYKTRQEMLTLADMLPGRAKECMTKKVFIISHPHGGEKVLSYGDSVKVKFDMNIAEDGKMRLAKLTGQQQAPSDFSRSRKLFLYAADTCQGASGAPVILFKKFQEAGLEETRYKLDVWVHNGIDRSYNLSATVLRICGPEDFLPPPASAQQTHQDSDDEDNPGNQPVTSPVYKVLTHPSYPAYILFNKRLDSFSQWGYHSIHKPHDLATAGFFYAGYADCVRCFQCGLGLKSWKPGDNVYTEHEKHRPTCPFLQAQIRAGFHNSTNTAGDDANIDPVSCEQVSDLTSTKTPTILAPNSTERNSSVLDNELEPNQQGLVSTLLAIENRQLKDQLKCKICNKAQIKDLFLPCGDLYACTDCSRLLTHCPSCSKAILATVTVYLT